MHLCVWADRRWEVVHHDGAAGARAAGHRAPGTPLLPGGGQGRAGSVPPGRKADCGAETWVSEAMGTGDVLEIGWEATWTSGPRGEGSLPPPEAAKLYEKSHGLVVGESWV